MNFWSTQLLGMQHEYYVSIMRLNPSCTKTNHKQPSQTDIKPYLNTHKTNNGKDVSKVRKKRMVRRNNLIISVDQDSLQSCAEPEK